MRCHKSTLCALTLGVLTSLPVSAQADNPVRNAELSARLFEAAVDLQDPFLAVAAARLRKSVLARRVDIEPQKDGPAPEDPRYDRLMSWQDMIATALQLAPNDPTIAKLAEDIDSGAIGPESKAGRPGFDALAAERQLDIVTFRDWQKIEEAEIAAARSGAPREKFTLIEEMIRAGR